MVNRKTNKKSKIRRNKKSKVSGFLNSVKYGFKGVKDALGLKSKSKKIIQIEKKISDAKKMSKRNVKRLEKQEKEERLVKYTAKEKETLDKKKKNKKKSKKKKYISKRKKKIYK